MGSLCRLGDDFESGPATDGVFDSRRRRFVKA